MKYSIATDHDFTACAACVASTGEHDPVNFYDIGGIVLMAKDDSGVQGVVWAVRTGTLAYADFLSVSEKFRGTGLGVRLMLKGAAILKRMGVTRIESQIKISNQEALKLHSRLGAHMDAPYALSTLVIGKARHGEENDHDSANK